MFPNPSWQLRIHDNIVASAYLQSSEQNIFVIQWSDLANCFRTSNRPIFHNFQWPICQSNSRKRGPKYWSSLPSRWEQYWSQSALAPGIRTVHDLLMKKCPSFVEWWRITKSTWKTEQAKRIMLQINRTRINKL